MCLFAVDFLVCLVTQTNGVIIQRLRHVVAQIILAFVDPDLRFATRSINQFVAVMPKLTAMLAWPPRRVPMLPILAAAGPFPNRALII